ncbi:MAG: hypothetical protein F6K35_04555 [Okeania sp. SIO2H7]|nr:hypothetical protein [Okeania sp. SIO2H7]
MPGKDDKGKEQFEGDEGGFQGNRVPGRWKREFYGVIAKELPVVQQSPSRPSAAQVNNTPYHDFPRWNLFQYTLDKSRPDESVFIYGNSALLPLQISLLNAIREMLRWELGGNSFEGNGIIRRAGSPKVTLFFEEDKPEDIASKDFTPVQGKLSFRLMEYLEFSNDLSKEVLTWEIIEKLAKTIYNAFQKPNNKKGLLWRKGKISFNYNDWNKGYGLKVLCQKESEGKDMVKKILSLRGHPYETLKASKSVPEYPLDDRNGTEITVLGERQKTPRFRPNATVRFRGAWLELSKRNKPIRLITRGTLETFPQ